MSTVIDLFERHGYVLELLACVAATTWKLERQERFAVRLTGILLAEVCFTIVWEQVPHNLYTEPLHFVDGLPQTTKGDARWHGFGVKSIRRIVQQHGGTLTMQAQDGMFRLVALLPLK